MDFRFRSWYVVVDLRSESLYGGKKISKKEERGVSYKSQSPSE